MTGKMNDRGDHGPMLKPPAKPAPKPQPKPPADSDLIDDLGDMLVSADNIFITNG